MDVVRTVRILEGTEDQEIPAWQVAQQQKVRRCMEDQAEKDETQTWQEKQQHKIKKMYGSTDMAGTTTTENKEMYGGPGLAVNTETKSKKVHGRTTGNRGENETKNPTSKSNPS